MQSSSEEVTLSDKNKNVLIDMKEEKTILAIVKLLNDDDVPTPKKKNKCSAK
jgi:hypothetical protein